ncbi:hypothetical protein SARC_09941 [Sphaeroforma arctica JP610]|uniref:Hexosyltransferase n=1 Tax=Sphaeroforma arctica JP610 TaxID=667725 RepID=A0A0L0FLH6_9EUKA|nr:hypothetical protein SARC_09941 [Sphaeroforma arctica JP610]KNC77600.1 hypothetical protein SARC_09941 [Sphaeroforma arctica JP610]|eukprot:XP_014151502.1 hypothetical protein SARC_09941 [Sphaeroforma arctica JP610]
MRASVNRSTTNNEETTQTTIRAKGQIRTGTKPVRDKPRLKERPAWMQKHTTGKSVRQLRDNRGKFNTDSDDIRRPTEPSRLSGLAVLPTDSHLEAVVVYMTHPAEIGARQYIRDTIAYTYTMGEYKHVPVAYYFVTGSGYLADRNGGVVKQSSDEGPGRSVRKRFDTQELYDEAEFFKDMIVLDDFEEDYFKLTSKTGATIARIDELLQIANTSARWYVKTDTDACVDHAVLLRTLTKNGARARVGDSAWMGMLYYNVPTRPGGNDSKWDDHTYTPSTYPPYMNGPLYALTWALVDAIASRHRQGDLVMYANEDAAVGVWLNESGIVPTPIEIKFPQWVERKYYITPAVCWDVPLVVHGCWTESDVGISAASIYGTLDCYNIR